jgi:hypothetical protein
MLPNWLIKFSQGGALATAGLCLFECRPARPRTPVSGPLVVKSISRLGPFTTAAPLRSSVAGAPCGPGQPAIGVRAAAM